MRDTLQFPPAGGHTLPGGSMTPKTIGFLINSSILGNINLILEGARSFAESKGARLVKCNLTPSFPAERHPAQLEMMVELMTSLRLDGLLYLGWMEEFSDMTKALKLLAPLGDVPFVNLGKEQLWHPVVHMDGGAQVTRLLRHAFEIHGQRRMLFVEPLSPDDRMDSYVRFMQEAGAWDPDLVIRMDDLDMAPAEQWHFERRADAVMDVIRKRGLVHRVDGVLSMYHRETLPLMGHFAREGRAYPEGPGFYCWDEDEWSPYTTPPLTTIHFPFWDLGHRGCAVLFDLMEGRPTSMDHALEGHLIVRESCGCGGHSLDSPLEDTCITFDRESFSAILADSLRTDRGKSFRDFLTGWMEARLVQTGFRKDFQADLAQLQLAARRDCAEALGDDGYFHYWAGLTRDLANRMDFLEGRREVERTEIQRSFADLGQKLLSGADREAILSRLPNDLAGVRMDLWVWLLDQPVRGMHIPAGREFRLARMIRDREDVTPPGRPMAWEGTLPGAEDMFPGAMDYLHLLHVNDSLLGFAVFRSAHHDERAFNDLAVQLSSALQSVGNLGQSLQAGRDSRKLLRLSQRLSLIREESLLLEELPDMVRRAFHLECAHCFLRTPDGVRRISGSDSHDHRNLRLLEQAANWQEGMRRPGSGIHTVILDSRREGSLVLVVKERQGSRVPRDPSFWGLLAEQLSSSFQASMFSQALHSAKRAAEYANQAKSQFLASMSHELRTPLNSILGFAQILENRSDLDSETRDDVSTIRQSGEHLLNLINDVLDMAKIESGHLELVADSLSLDTFLKELHRMIRMRAWEKHLTLHWEVPDNLPGPVSVDTRRLRQVLLNLLANAIKFTEKGWVRFRIDLGDHDSGSVALHFAVGDTGPGIAPADRERLFHPFEQAGDHKSRAAGAGLGLAISRELVRSMGGDIACDSAPGRGSTFSFGLRLPRAEGKDSAHPGISGPVALPAGLRYRLLVVDDKRNNRAFMVRCLKPLGFDLDEAEDGLEALDCVRNARPDLILTDLVMPNMDGFELIRNLKLRDNWKDIPVVVVSASVFQENSRMALELGADAFLPKPLDVRLLMDTLRKFLPWDLPEESSRSPEPEKDSGTLPPPELREGLARLVREGSILEADRLLQEYRDSRREWDAYWTNASRLASGFQEAALLALLEGDVHG